MFTGIVQGMGKITDIAQPSPDFRTHTVELPPEIADICKPAPLSPTMAAA